MTSARPRADRDRRGAGLRRTGLAALLAAGTLLGACASDVPPSLFVPRGPEGRFGYSEKRLGPASFEVVYVGPEVKTTNTVPIFIVDAADRAKETTRDLALWRAARLALDQGSPAFAVTDEKAVLQEVVIGRDYRDVRDPTYEHVVTKYGVYSAQYYFRPRVTLVIELRDRPGDGALDARETAERIERRYADAPARPIAAGTVYYFGPASWLSEYRVPAEYESPAKPAPAPAPRYQPTHPFVPYHGAK